MQRQHQQWRRDAAQADDVRAGRGAREQDALPQHERIPYVHDLLLEEGRERHEAGARVNVVDVRRHVDRELDAPQVDEVVVFLYGSSRVSE